MRALLLLLTSGFLFAQSATEFEKALTGQWVGTLEYRDFSEPAGSTKRVKLPTWLTIEQQQNNLQFQYVYDDGPAKVVRETSLVRIEGGGARYCVLDKNGNTEDSYAVEGFDQLRQGRGNLTLRGPGLENKKPVNVKTTIRIGRNILEITRETESSGEPLAFRHAYTLVRALSPVIH